MTMAADEQKRLIRLGIPILSNRGTSREMNGSEGDTVFVASLPLREILHALGDDPIKL